MPDKTTYLKDYKKSAFAVDKVDLNFDLYEDYVLVTSQLILRRQAPGALHLFGEGVELLSIHMNDLPLEASHYQIINDDILIPVCPEQCCLSIVTRIYPQKNTRLSGLYRSDHLFCTHCEAQGFRRITFFPDRPDVLSVFTTRISADKKKYPVLLSNGNLLGRGDSNNGRHWVIWQDPIKKPSYLFALVAGDLACVRDNFITQSGRSVDLRIYVEPGEENKCTHAMASLKKAMRWDEKNYGREYDLDIYMIVAVSHFNMGAMENKGLNIFNSKYILVSPHTATDQDYADVETVVAHEYFHNWTGNRVTCRDWFQLSLKEGLTVFRDQEFSRDMHSRDVKRIMDVKILFAAQFPEDASSMAHPVRPDSYQEINNFYTATVYNKGAEVIRMQYSLLGAEGFRKGMDLYFERHDGHAVTIDDFIAAMEDANQVDFSQLKRWYTQAGTPEVDVETDFYQGCLSINLKQRCPLTPEKKMKRPFHIPLRIALFDELGRYLPLEKDILELKEEEQCFKFQNLQSKPTVSLLRDFSSPVKLHYPLKTEERLALLRFETNGYSKWQQAQCLAVHCMQQWLVSTRADWAIPTDLLAVYKDILIDDRLDASLRAELLSPPWFQEVISSLSEVDVSLVEQVRDGFRSQLGQYLFSEAKTLYQTLWEAEDHQMNAEAYGRRKLRNICLVLMMKSNEAEALALCQRQFSSALTMTDQLAGFSLLVNSTSAVSQQACTDFYQKWQQESLVVEKWFAVQASCESPDTLKRVKELLKHEAFSMTNPNLLYALIGSFCMRNPRNFHAVDGSGYDFLTAMLLIIDKMNPQLAARLANPFTRWQHLNKPRQRMISQCLQQLSNADLSRNLAELVEKSLPSV